MGTDNDTIASKVGNGSSTPATIDLIEQKKYQDQAPAIGDTKSPPPSTVNPFGSMK